MQTFKFVYNNSYGGFDLSDLALEQYNLLSGTQLKPIDVDEIKRSDPILSQLVETMGEDVNPSYSNLKIKEFPIKYKGFIRIIEYDGLERVSVDYDKYFIYHVKQIENDTISSDEKMVLISQLIQEHNNRPNNSLDEYEW